MGLLDKWKSKGVPKAAPADWDNAFKANVNCYGKEGEEPFGALVLTEDTPTILPKEPWKQYALDGRPLTDWKLVLVSITKKGVVGIIDYAAAMEKLTAYLWDQRQDCVLTWGLSLAQLETLFK